MDGEFVISYGQVMPYVVTRILCLRCFRFGGLILMARMTIYLLEKNSSGIWLALAKPKAPCGRKGVYRMSRYEYIQLGFR